MMNITVLAAYDEGRDQPRPPFLEVLHFLVHDPTRVGSTIEYQLMGNLKLLVFHLIYSIPPPSSLNFLVH